MFVAGKHTHALVLNSKEITVLSQLAQWPFLVNLLVHQISFICFLSKHDQEPKCCIADNTDILIWNCNTRTNSGLHKWGATMQTRSYNFHSWTAQFTLAGKAKQKQIGQYTKTYNWRIVSQDSLEFRFTVIGKSSQVLQIKTKVKEWKGKKKNAVILGRSTACSWYDIRLHFSYSKPNEVGGSP